MNEDRLENIETKLAFQEKLIKELNDVLYAQQKQIDRLTSMCEAMAESGTDNSSSAPANEKPPHY